MKRSRLLEALLDRSETEPMVLVAVAALIWLGAVGVAVAGILLVAVIWSWMPWSLVAIPMLVLMWWATRSRLDR